jgi:hypothetical protein
MTPSITGDVNVGEIVNSLVSEKRAANVAIKLMIKFLKRFILP